MTLPRTGLTLYAAGGSDNEAEINISLHAPYPSTEVLWSLAEEMWGLMNASVLLASHIPGSEEPRLIVTNIDCETVFYNIPVRARPETLADLKCGTLRLDYDMNHCKSQLKLR